MVDFCTSALVSHLIHTMTSTQVSSLPFFSSPFLPSYQEEEWDDLLKWTTPSVLNSHKLHWFFFGSLLTLLTLCVLVMPLLWVWSLDIVMRQVTRDLTFNPIEIVLVLCYFRETGIVNGTLLPSDQSRLALTFENEGGIEGKESKQRNSCHFFCGEGFNLRSEPHLSVYTPEKSFIMALEHMLLGLILP